jgi:hypothetical protein
VPKAMHSRDDLIMALRGRCKSTACERALSTGDVYVLGGFAPSRGITVPFWAVEVHSKHGKMWTFAIYHDKKPGTYKVTSIGSVSWLRWGGLHDGPANIYNGDAPFTYGKLKLIAEEPTDD